MATRKEAAQQPARKVPVTERALVQRVSRALRNAKAIALANEQGWNLPAPPLLLHITRQRPPPLDDVFVVDLRNNTVAESFRFTKLESLARALGVLKPWEQLQPEA